ncbi:PilZ domain-containing protein [Sphingomonas sp. 1P06PA]|uniref:PilZ domain-containing protein n=1 Tax=Sphingomonas sp. 1P06PA TaxID=554121 RepID=UPI0039A5159C
MTVSAHLDMAAPASEQAPRRARRLSVKLDAALRQQGASGAPVQLIDLSTDGFQTETFEKVRIGTQVWLRLPGIEPQQARVCWVRGARIGCAFLTPLHAAVLSRFVPTA